MPTVKYDGWYFFAQKLKGGMHVNEKEVFEICNQIDSFIAEYLAESIVIGTSYDMLEAHHGILPISRNCFYRRRRKNQSDLLSGKCRRISDRTYQGDTGGRFQQPDLIRPFYGGQDFVANSKKYCPERTGSAADPEKNTDDLRSAPGK